MFDDPVNGRNRQVEFVGRQVFAKHPRAASVREGERFQQMDFRQNLVRWASMIKNHVTIIEYNGKLLENKGNDG